MPYETYAASSIQQLSAENKKNITNSDQAYLEWNIKILKILLGEHGIRRTGPNQNELIIILESIDKFLKYNSELSYLQTQVNEKDRYQKLIFNIGNPKLFKEEEVKHAINVGEAMFNRMNNAQSNQPRHNQHQVAKTSQVMRTNLDHYQCEQGAGLFCKDINDMSNSEFQHRLSLYGLLRIISKFRDHVTNGFKKSDTYDALIEQFIEEIMPELTNIMKARGDAYATEDVLKTHFKKFLLSKEGNGAENVIQTFFTQKMNELREQEVTLNNYERVIEENIFVKNMIKKLVHPNMQNQFLQSLKNLVIQTLGGSPMFLARLGVHHDAFTDDTYERCKENEYCPQITGLQIDKNHLKKAFEKLLGYIKTAQNETGRHQKKDVKNAKDILQAFGVENFFIKPNDAPQKRQIDLHNINGNVDPLPEQSLLTDIDDKNKAQTLPQNHLLRSPKKIVEIGDNVIGKADVKELVFKTYRVEPDQNYSNQVGDVTEIQNNNVKVKFNYNLKKDDTFDVSDIYLLKKEDGIKREGLFYIPPSGTVEEIYCFNCNVGNNKNFFIDAGYKIQELINRRNFTRNGK